jgi:hypothetical protein
MRNMTRVLQIVPVAGRGVVTFNTRYGEAEGIYGFLELFLTAGIQEGKRLKSAFRRRGTFHSVLPSIQGLNHISDTFCKNTVGKTN